MPFFNQGNVNLYYEDTGLKSGATLLLIPGGGLNSKISYFNDRSPFNPINEFKSKMLPTNFKIWILEHFGSTWQSSLIPNGPIPQ